MWIHAMLIALALIGAAAESPEPKTSEAETVSIALRDGTTVYGTIVNKNDRAYLLRVDTPPWKRETLQTILLGDIASGPEPERPMARKDRQQRDWEAQGRRDGYRMLETPSGVLWVQKDQIALAKRARELAGENDDQDNDQTASAPNPVAPETTMTEVPPEAPPPLGAFRRWGPEMVLALGTLALAGLAFKLLAAR